MKLAEKDSKDEIQKAFNLFDKDHTGLITFQNLKQIASELGEELNDEEILVSVCEKHLPLFIKVHYLLICNTFNNYISLNIFNRK